MSVVSSYSVPVAEVVGRLVDFSETPALGYQVLPVEDMSSSLTSSALVEVPCASSWAEFAATTAVGLVPVLGPLVNSVYHATKGQYVSALVDVVCAGVDVYTIAYAASGTSSAEASGTKIVLKESSELLLGEMCIKKLMMGARNMLVSPESMKQMVKKGGESVVKKTVSNCVIIRSAVVKTTTSALSTATNVFVEKSTGCGCGGNKSEGVVSLSEEPVEAIEELTSQPISVGDVGCQ